MGWGCADEQEKRETRPLGLVATTACICIAIFSQREVLWRFYFYTGISRGKRSLDRHGHWTLQFAHTWHVIHGISPQDPTIDSEA